MKKAYIIRATIITIIGTLSILAIFGLLYPFKIMDLQFGSLVLRIFNDFSFWALILLFALIILTFLFGKIYCSTICPFGILQEGLDILYKKIARKKKKNQPQKNYKYKYIAAFVIFGVSLGGSTVLIKYIDPYTIFSNVFTFGITGLIVTVLVAVLVFFKNRFFCTNICPVGAILGFISKYSIFKINMNKADCVACGVCARSCPAGCINIKDGKIDNEMCLKCFKCVRICPQNAINYSESLKEISEIEFSPTRRKALIGLGALGVFGALVGVGVTFSKKMASKIKNIILPPGAKSANRMANKCLNCNLCINNCPTKILTKANKDFGAAHIDYSKGKGYCEFNCKNCGDICPSGAIKKLSYEDKQATRIAIAVIENNCKKCGKCEGICPTGAIEINEKGEYIVNGLKCIGCAKCKTVCENGSISIHPVNEQTII